MSDVKRYWNEKDLEMFLTICKRDTEPITYPLFRMVAWSGLRPEEIVALQKVDINGKMVNVPETEETSSRRFVAMDEDTLRAVENWLKNEITSSFVFPVSISAMRRKLSILCRKAKLPPLELEDFRPMLKMNLRHQGISDLAINDRLG